MSTTVPSGDVAGSYSTIMTAAASGYHVLKIEGYSRTKMLPNGKLIVSTAFHVGGHAWRIVYCPNGWRAASTDAISLYLQLDAAADKDVYTEFQFSLLHPAGEQEPPSYRKTMTKTFRRLDNSWGHEVFIEREVLEKSVYLKDDCFTVRCDVTVMMEPRIEKRHIEVPPSNMHRHFASLFESKKGTDVNFKVGHKMLAAHRCVLAARSPVFKAELFGCMKEKTAKCINIYDMNPDVFEALLHFIYTDTLPKIKEEEAAAMVQNLLVAADRYDLERLKLICEDKLSKHIDKDSVGFILATAEELQCRWLKDACFSFLASHPVILREVVAEERFEHLTTSHPSLLKEFIVKLSKIFTLLCDP